MSVIINKTWSAFFNSDPLSGSTNLSADGTQFSVTLNNPLRIPASCVSCKMGVVNASIWNTSPNIAAAYNNNIFAYTIALTPYSITIPDGLYSLSQLQSYLNSQFVERGQQSNQFLFIPNAPTSQVYIQYLNNTYGLNFTGNTVGKILGFPLGVYPYSSTVGGILQPPAGYIAKFNRNNTYLVRTNFVNSGIPINSNAQGIIASIPIPSDSINNLIAYQPNQISWFDCSELISTAKSNFYFILSNEDLQPTPTNGESWNITVLIEYSILLTDQDVPLMP